MISRMLGKIASSLALYSCLVTPVLTMPAPGSQAATGSMTARSEGLLRWADLSSLKIGSRIKLLLFDGQPRTGTYAGMEPIPENEYSGKFSLAREQAPEGLSLPALGEPISVDDKLGKTYAGEFQGFDKGYLLLKQDGKAQASLVDLRMVSAIHTVDQAAVDLQLLSARLQMGRFPFRSSLVLGTKTGRTSTPLEEVAYVMDGNRGVTSTLAKGVVFMVIAGALSAFVISLFRDPQQTDWLKW